MRGNALGGVVILVDHYDAFCALVAKKRASGCRSAAASKHYRLLALDRNARPTYHIVKAEVIGVVAVAFAVLAVYHHVNCTDSLRLGRDNVKEGHNCLFVGYGDAIRVKLVALDEGFKLAWSKLAKNEGVIAEKLVYHHRKAVTEMLADKSATERRISCFHQITSEYEPR